MEKSFNASAGDTANANTKSSDLTITTDCAGTLLSLSGARAYNFDLLSLLCDAHKAGHKVIVTSSSATADIKDIIELAAEFGELEGYDLEAAHQFECMTKTEVMRKVNAGELSVDIAFDDEPIAHQEYFSFSAGKNFPLIYAQPKLEVRVKPDFSTTPLSLDLVRDYMSMFTKGNGSAPLPGPTPQ